MTLKIATLERIGEFLAGCKNLFATQSEVTENTTDIDEHLLNVDYTKIEFDTSEVVS